MVYGLDLLPLPPHQTISCRSDLSVMPSVTGKPRPDFMVPQSRPRDATAHEQLGRGPIVCGVRAPESAPLLAISSVLGCGP